MAPVLRKRKTAVEATEVKTTQIDDKSTSNGKRKAGEDGSPVSSKKQKPTKKSAVTAESKTEKSTKKSKTNQPAKVVEEVDKETVLAVDDLTDSEDEEEDQAQTLAAQVDVEEEAEVPNGGEVFKPGQDVGTIPEAAKNSKSDSAKRSDEPGVLYIGRIPHGFYEHEMKQYFSQFGPINRIRLSRNKKTGASKHFAFVEFAEASTAEIVAKTMDNYLLFGHILKCKIIPKEQVHEDLFKGANRRFKSVPWNKMAGKQLEKPRSESAWGNKLSREQSKRSKKAAKLKALGYDFEPPQLKEIPAPAAIEPAETEVKTIEAPPSEETAKAGETPVIEAASPEDEETEIKTISAPKTKAVKGKASKGAKAKRVKA